MNNSKSDLFRALCESITFQFLYGHAEKMPEVEWQYVMLNYVLYFVMAIASRNQL